MLSMVSLKESPLSEQNANTWLEYTYGEQYGWDTDRLRDHWNTWITEGDFEEMASMGLNTARLPSESKQPGYWEAQANAS